MKLLSTIVIHKNKVIITDGYSHPRFSVVNRWFKPINYLIYRLCKNQRTFPLEGLVIEQEFPGLEEQEPLIKELQKYHSKIKLILHTFDDHR